MNKKEFKELEYKYDATGVSFEEFEKLIRTKKIIKELKITGPDEYWSNNQFVIRYRSNKNMDQLTVKLRENKRSTTSRLELNLDIKRGKKPKLLLQSIIRMFLTAVGFSHEFTLVKKCHIFWIEEDGMILVPVIYTIENDGKQIIEVEIEEYEEKKQAIGMLKKWSGVLKDAFGLTDQKRINSSLYEMYSGKQYLHKKELTKI